jgi:hypothetical protein
MSLGIPKWFRQMQYFSQNIIPVVGEGLSYLMTTRGFCIQHHQTEKAVNSWINNFYTAVLM